MPKKGPLHTVSIILKHIMSSAAESEVGANFVNAIEDVPIRIILEELGYVQRPKLMETNNSLTRSNKDDPKPWTCISFGSEIDSNKGSSAFIGAQAMVTLVTILPNTIPLPIIKR
jgi:hypothetical protein